jgi:hypothetical protein
MDVNSGKGLWHVGRMASSVGVFQSQRDCVLQPRVARNELPWEIVGRDSQPQTGLWPSSARTREKMARKRVLIPNSDVLYKNTDIHIDIQYRYGMMRPCKLKSLNHS